MTARFGRHVVVRVLLGLAVLGCRQGAGNRVREEPRRAKPQAASARPPDAVGGVHEHRIPVSEDFEQRARREITAENMDQRLTELEREIGPIYE